MTENYKSSENLILIDTDILIFILRKHTKAIQKSKEYQKNVGILKISELVYYECLRGFKYSGADKKLKIFQQLINETEIIPLTRNIYNKASEIYAFLKKKGFPTGEFDLLIASTALVNNLKLITNNKKHFEKIIEHFGLQTDNWVK